MYVRSYYKVDHYDASSSLSKMTTQNFNSDIDRIILISDDQSNYVIVDCSMHEFLEVHDGGYATQSILNATNINVENKLKGND